MAPVAQCHVCGVVLARASEPCRALSLMNTNFFFVLAFRIPKLPDSHT